MPKLVVCTILALSTLAIYWPVTGHQFISYDDREYVTDNDHVQAGLTSKSLYWSFTTPHAANWHPLTWLSHILDVHLHGTDAGGHHLTSLLLHVANTVLLLCVLCRMTGARWSSSFVAALFALHPLHVESVAWVAERKDVLSTFFWMLTLLAYVRYVERPAVNRYLPVVLFLALGLMSKPMLVTLPFVLLLLDYWPLKRFRPGQPGGTRLVLEKVPLFALSTASAVVTNLVQRAGGTVEPLSVHPISFRIANALVSYVAYLRKMLWPGDLAVFYPFPRAIPWWHVAGALLLLASISLVAIRAARRNPYLVVGWLWYLGTLVPVIGLVQVGAQAMADRYTYVPLIGIFIIIAWGAPDLLARWRHAEKGLAVAAIALLSLLAAATLLQVRHWARTHTLFEHALRVTEDNYVAHYNLGIDLLERNETTEAIRHLAEAVRIQPRFAEAHNNLGNSLEQLGRRAEAIDHYSRALRANPSMATAHYNLGLALAKQGKAPEAIHHLSEALRTRPGYAEAHNNLAIVLADQGRTDEAIDHLAEALRIDPEYARAHFNLGVVLADQGRLDEAIRHYSEALRIDPDDLEARRRLDRALAMRETEL